MLLGALPGTSINGAGMWMDTRAAGEVAAAAADAAAVDADLLDADDRRVA